MCVNAQTTPRQFSPARTWPTWLTYIGSSKLTNPCPTVWPNTAHVIAIKAAEIANLKTSWVRTVLVTLLRGQRANKLSILALSSAKINGVFTGLIEEVGRVLWIRMSDRG